MIRKPVYAGTWYPVSYEEAKEYLNPTLKKYRAYGAVCPHAGWVYSGKTAGSVFSSLEAADTYFLIGPNHSARGTATSIFPSGQWEMPFGTLNIDTEAAALMLKQSEFIEENFIAHYHEHALEVQCPFIIMANPQAHIVPLTMRDYSREVCFDVGRSLADAIRKSPHKKSLMIASS
ncbi:MAG: AmmeMemoRadiSam system protein B, partial [Elusimicrobia bacterium]|nr:AmmeMemoRadiSam system protein B [Elusimicrobiota bacterium]